MHVIALAVPKPPGNHRRNHGRLRRRSRTANHLPGGPLPTVTVRGPGFVSGFHTGEVETVDLTLLDRQCGVMPYCSDCGMQVDPEDVHCYNCGNRLDSDPSRPTGGPGDAGTSGGGYQYDGDDRYGRGGQYGPDSPTRGEDRTDAAWGDPGGPGGPGHGTQHGPPGAQAGRGASARRVEDGKVGYSLRFPFTDDYGALVLGGLCNLLSILVVPLFTLWGYTYDVTEFAGRGETTQPEFEEFLDLTKRGVLYFLVAMVVPLIGTALGVALFVLGDSLQVQSAVAVLGAGLTLVLLYIYPAVLTLYPVTGSATEALSPERIVDFAFTSTYVISFLVYFVLSVVLYFLYYAAFFVLFLTVIGIVLLIPLVLGFTPYFLYFTGVFWGATYYEAEQKGLVSGSVEEDPPYYSSGESDPY